MTIRKVTIYGERSSGTHFLEEVLLLNFDVEIVGTHGWKHFFGFQDLHNTDDVLFIGIVRNLEDWVNSLYRARYHLPSELVETVDTYLNNTFYSVYDDGTEIMDDRNIETHTRYKNIFEMRHVKNKFLIETMPALVKNYCLITHDDLCTNFTEIMNKIKNHGLEIKNSSTKFPVNILHDIKFPETTFTKKENKIPKNVIVEKANLFYEKVLFPKLF